LEKVKKEIKEELTYEIRALLVDRLEELCLIEPKIKYGEIKSLNTNIGKHFFSQNRELTELAAEGSKIASEIINIRNKREIDATQEAINVLQKLIKKEESKDLNTLYSDLDNLRDLIPIEITEKESLTGRQLTPAEVEAYQQNKEAADEKELKLLKKIFKLERAH